MTVVAGQADRGNADRLSGLEACLRRALSELGSVLVAFSGGADSAYLAWVAADVLGERAWCVTAVSASYPSRHRAAALQFVERFGLRHEVITTNELDDPRYRANAPDRCFHCKSELFTRLTERARARGLAAVLDGNNADDRGDYRPGRAAARALGVRSLLDEAGLSKADIRELSRRAGLPTWDQPASACLSSRVPYHTAVTPEVLRQIETAEDALADLGFAGCRVRHHGELARIELGLADLLSATEDATRLAIVAALKQAGYRYVTLDLQGYRTGSLNEGLLLQPVSS